jgi:GR25 family glycosyltransferase involved in LPS biosynthesis
MENCDFYCLSFNNPERKKAMENRFSNLGINAFFSDGVSFEDDRIKNSNGHKRTLSFTYGHLDLIKEFYFNSEKDYGIICEDDIIIRKNLIEQMHFIVKNFKKMNLDLLLLGYLLNYKFNSYESVNEEHPFNYYSYPDSIWGAQMYMISKKQAHYLIKTYSPPYAELTLSNTNLKPFNSDWIFTKEGKRALIYPLIAIEDGKTKYDNQSQQTFHDECFNFNYIKDTFYE